MENQNLGDKREIFLSWIVNPSEIGINDLTTIQLLTRKYPYCQILKSLEAKGFHQQRPEEFTNKISEASLYSPNRTVLYALIHHPENLIPIELQSKFEVIENGDYSADLISLENNKEELLSEFKTADRLDIREDGNFTIDEIPTLESEDFISPEAYKSWDLSENEFKNKEEKIILENISSTDFFAFEQKLDILTGELNKEPASKTVLPHEEELTKSPETASDPTPETNEIARYDDDQMPYSFLWWLQKTRKEHAETYQPYADFKLDTTRKIINKPAIELNQQIAENIFHLQTPFTKLKENLLSETIPFEVKSKEEEIIEKFIREEPQINPPSADKLDMENKARKSAEDPNDLVSETLAGIYTEQMLFQKAIDTYQKLSLKFPEKRAYFADQISDLEKKIN
ncbi:MAG: hypothetical protein H7096_01195 [Flavobacterium sp.]|nr:hypothetical protein [Pedobacter sp.]